MNTEQEDSADEAIEPLAPITAGESEPVAEAPLASEIVVGTAVFSPIDTIPSDPDDEPIPVNKTRPAPLNHVEGEPPMTETVTSSPAPANPPVAAAPVSQRRGCVLLLLGAVLGSLLGMIFSLAILLGLNGTLTFSQTDAQLRRDITEANIRQEALQDALSTRDAQVDALATRLEGFDSQQADIDASLRDVSQEMATVEGQVTAVSGDILTLDDRLDLTESQIETAAAAAESFNSFLGGLRELLLEVEPSGPTPTAVGGSAPSATPTPANKITPTTGTDEGTAVGSATAAATATGAAPATATSQPTRTPRPTRTPLPALATNTPTQQP